MIDYPRKGKTGFSRWVPSFKLFIGLVGFCIIAVFGLVALAVIFTPIPEPNEVARAEQNIVYWNDGHTEMGRIGESNRVSVPLSDVPLVTQHAVLAAEDRDYFKHGGFDPMALGRATWGQLRGEAGAGGASTITQQYARNAFLSQEQSIVRKVREIILSIKLDFTESKEDILSNYLNTIYFGRGAYGIESASQAYFGRPSSKLNLNQSVALAAIIQQPTNLDPEKNPEALRARMDYVADGMLKEGWITQAQRNKIRMPEFKPYKKAKNAYKGTNGYLLDSVRRQMLTLGYTEEQINLGGFHIVSTFDRDKQRAAVEAVENSGLDQSNGLRIGLSSVEPSTGEIKALYGGRDYLKNQLSNADQAIALAGSTFKTFTLAAAFEDDIGLNSLWNGNSPINQGGHWLHNENNVSYGTVSLETATERSVNTAFALVGDKVGHKAVMQSAIRAGLPENTVGLVADGQTTLGTSSPTTLDMASAYATFANQGNRIAPTSVLKVSRAGNKTEYEYTPAPTRAFSTDVANTVNYTLQQVVNSGTGTRALSLGKPAAGKTGTTDNNRSAWFSGYTPNLSTAVALSMQGKDGNAESLSSLGLGHIAGGSYPASIWTNYMSQALANDPEEEFTLPEKWPGDYNPVPWMSNDDWQPYEPTSEPPTSSPTESPTGSPSGSPTGTPTQSQSPQNRQLPVPGRGDADGTPFDLLNAVRQLFS
ncbi:MAG: transglycosylase domain-containing protein [Candidatus Nanopelagicales bacterium]